MAHQGGHGDAHIVVKEAVEAQILEAALVMGLADLVSDVLAENGGGVAAADAELPIVGVAAAGLGQVDLVCNGHGFSLLCN